MGRVYKPRAGTATWSGRSSADTVREPAAPPRRKAREVMVGAGSMPPYRLLEVIGEGGMARVYLAEHTVLGKRVAIKTLLPQFEFCFDAHELLLREARIAGMIRHPNLVDVYDFATDSNGRPYYVMELAAGETLGQRLANGPLLLSQGLDIIINIADAVAAVHEAGYLHRDIKAENVLLASDGRRVVAKLIDFGIARPIAPDPERRYEGMVGTPRSMAPEQISQDEVDERTDIWALGVLFYEILTGEMPFPIGSSTREDLVAVLTEPPRPLPLDVTGDIRAIVGACLSKEPEERPPSAAVLVARLRAAQGRYLARHDMVERALEDAEEWSPAPFAEARLRSPRAHTDGLAA